MILQVECKSIDLEPGMCKLPTNTGLIIRAKMDLDESQARHMIYELCEAFGEDFVQKAATE